MQDDRAMYAEYLRQQGFQPIEIGDTAAAEALATSADVIVTGIRVPGPFDGLELVRRLRGGDGTCEKPLIVLTACALAIDEQHARAAGCDVFLRKPCLPDTLIRHIRQTLHLRSSSRLVPSSTKPHRKEPGAA
jgi:two-component system cell cycle response regulator DivK